MILINQLMSIKRSRQSAMVKEAVVQVTVHLSQLSARNGRPNTFSLITVQLPVNVLRTAK
jgi:hypothetical protein